MELTLQKVFDQKTIKQFLAFPVQLNSKNPNYIRPLDIDIERIFDPKINKYFKHGTCERFLIIDQSKKCVVGKFAVFTNELYIQEQATGGIGFVDFIDDIKVSTFLFDAAKKWLLEKGMEAMDGPINFGEREQWWGLLVEGFHEPLYTMNYNLPYYQKHFENYGFKVYFNQLCFGRKINAPLSRAFELGHKRISRNPAIRLETIKVAQLKKYAKDFTIVYNKAWLTHGEGKQMSEQQAQLMFHNLRNAVDSRIAFIAYENENPIGVWINLPDLNQWLKHFNGQLNMINKLRFLYFRWQQKNTRMVGLIFGVIPEWQGKGLDGYMVYEGSISIPQQTKYEIYEMQWIGDFNPKMIKLAEHLNTEITRKLCTYRYLFDRNKSFQRHPMI